MEGAYVCGVFLKVEARHLLIEVYDPVGAHEAADSEQDVHCVQAKLVVALLIYLLNPFTVQPHE